MVGTFPKAKSWRQIGQDNEKIKFRFDESNKKAIFAITFPKLPHARIPGSFAKSFIDITFIVKIASF